MSKAKKRFKNKHVEKAKQLQNHPYAWSAFEKDEAKTLEYQGKK